MTDQNSTENNSSFVREVTRGKTVRNRTIQLFNTLMRPFMTGLLLILALVLFNSVQITTADPLPPISFLAGQSLSGHSVQFPTSVQFGPDNRLYVLQKDGQIDIYKVSRNGPGDYEVDSTEVINLVRNIPNHNDDGSSVNLGSERQATGFTIVGTADTPVIYVSSSDPRRGINGDEAGLNIDTNSGTISRLIWDGVNRDDPTGDWLKVDLVRGLPRSAEYHATNGLQYDAVNNRLFVTSGGHANMGAPDLSLSFVPEYALSAAILEIDLTAIEAMAVQNAAGAHPYIYDIPTLTSGNDANDPFGGQRGENQAMIVENGPVQVYSPGYRNPYDLVLTESGRLYATDNGPNSGFGRFLKTEADRINPNTSLPYGPGQCTNDPADASFPAGYTGRDQLHLVTEGFYGGHPAPIRGNTSNQYNGQSPIAVSYDGTPECDFLWSGDSLANIEDGSLTTWGGSTNGIAEYTAGNFAGQMQGDLLTASYAGGGSIYRVQLSTDGQTAISNNVLFNMGGNPLDITAQSDFDIFPGTIWVVTPWPSNVIVYEPADYGGVDLGTCDPSVPTEDSDNDGYTNADEELNNTSPCNAASYPRDNDGDFISDRADPDDDNDGIADEDDFFQIDADNGTTTNLPVFYDFDPGGTNFGTGLAGGGFTGMMIDPGTGTDYLDLFDTDLMTVGGIAKVFVVDNVTAGTARGASNNQEYAFQKGINVDSSTGSFTFRSRVPSPYFEDDPQPGQEIGIYIGIGDQDNYLQLAINAAGFVLVEEVAGTPTVTQTNLDPFASNYIDLFLTVDPAAGAVVPRYMLDDGIIVNLAPVTLQAGSLKSTLANTGQAPAIGFIATSAGADSFAAIWDSLSVSVDQPGVLVSNVNDYDFGLVGTATIRQATFTLENPGLAGDPDIEISSMDFTGSTELTITSTHNYPLTLSPQETVDVTVAYAPISIGLLSATLDIAYNDSIQNQTLNVALSGESFNYTPAIIRVNSGGGEIADDPIPWERDTTANPSQYLVANVNTSSGAFGTNTTDAPNAIFTTERWNNGEIHYSFSGPQIANGTYEVRLYFAETCNCAIPGGSPGDRKFDIVIDDVLVADDFDQYDEAGQTQNGIMRAYTTVVDATNPAIDVKIQKGSVENSSIKGVEIVPISIDPAPGLPSSTVSIGTAFVRNSVTGIVQIKNLATIGGGDLEITGLSIDNPVFELINLPVLPVTLSPQETLDIQVRFSPEVTGIATANLMITFNADKDITIIPLTGEGDTPGETLYRVNAGGPLVAATDGDIDWEADTIAAPSPYGNTATAGNTVANGAYTGTTNNTGAPNAIFNNERWDGTPATPMIYTFPITDGNYEVRLFFAETYTGVTAAGQRLFDVSLNGQLVLDNFDQYATALAETGNARDAIVRAFAVNVVGESSIAIQFTDAGPDNPALKAIEILSTDPHPPELTVSATSLEFGQELVGETGIQQTITLRNEATGVDDYIEITPNDISPNFNIVSPTNFDRLDPQQELDVVIEFIPQSAAVFSIPFEISHNGTNASPVTVTLNAEGIVPAKSLTAGVTQIDFGTRETNTTSPAVQVNLTNDGSSGGPIEVQSVTISGPNADNFTEDFDIPFTLIVGETTGVSTAINVVFAPTTVGNKSGVLEITHDGNNSPLQIPLSGQAIETQRPYITGVIPANNATGVAVDISISFDLFLPNLGAGADSATLTSENIILRKVSDGQQVAANYGTSGGTDTIVIIPQSNLENNTLYSVEITDGVQDQSGAQFLPFTSSFTTGSSGGSPLAGVAFNKFLNIGIADNLYISTLEIGPDGRLYAASAGGAVMRWDISGDGTLKNEYMVAFFPNKTIIGLEFDPLSTATNMTMWISRNELFSDSAVYSIQFSGELVKLQGTDVGGVGEAWISTPYVVGLPRSVKDHLTNSIAWGPNGERAFYVNSGAINSGGDRDNAWGQQPETILSAATLRVDLNLLESYVATNGGPLDVRTGVMSPHPQAGGSLPANAQTLLDQNNYGLGDPILANFYDPQAPGAPVTIYGSGVRNAYDLLWHSNGILYVPTNGSGAGGNTPATPPLANLPSSCKARVDHALYGDYTAPSVPAALNISKQHDYLFRVVEGGYYGHPNPTRCEWVINGGNPTAGVDPGTPQVGTDYYPIGTQPDRNWRGNAFDFKTNVSANGVIEYQSSAFGGKLQGMMIIARYNAGRDFIILQPGPSGNIINSYTKTPGLTGFQNQPLDIVEDPATGNLYVAELAQNGSLTRVTLLKPDPVLAQQANISVSPLELVFNQVAGGPPSAPQTVTINNIGQSTLNISSINTVGEFNIIGTPPNAVAPGGFITVNVAFQPTFVGTQVGNLTIVSNDLDEPSVVVTLRGLGTLGEGGNNEPSLQAIINTYGIPVTVGDDNINTTVIHSSTPTAPLLGQELPIQSFEKAGPGVVDIQLLAVFGPNPTNGTSPVTRVGWYETGISSAQQELFSVNNGNGQSLNPATTGNFFFDPLDKAFGFYSEWPFFSGRKVFSEDSLNSWDTQNQHHVRVYPLRDANGIVPNAYIVATEEHTSGNDFQDVVFIVRNVKSAAAAAGVIETPNRMIFSDVVGGAASPARQLTIENVGVADISISSITTAAPFEIISSIPATIPVGQSVNINIVFNPLAGQAGVHVVPLTIVSNAAIPSVQVQLRGLGTFGTGGDLEPSLQWILDTYDIGVDVGDDNDASTTINSNTALASGLFIGDEVRIQRFEKAGSGPVTLEPLAAYAINHTPVVTVGWFRSDTPGQLQPVFTVNNGSSQTLNVATSGTLSFDPGTGVPFGMYAKWDHPTWNGRVTHTQDSLNTFANAIPHHARIFPLKDSGGADIPNAYIVAYEEFTQGYDYNDIVYIVRNVTPSSSAVNGITFENRDWVTLNGLGIPQFDFVNTWMSFSRIGKEGIGHQTHDDAVLRIRNNGQTLLTVNSITISNTNKNVDFDGDGNANDMTTATAFTFDGPGSFTIAPGSFRDVTVRFVMNMVDNPDFNHKGIYYDTLTVNSNDLANPNATVTLAGGFMEQPEGTFEIYAPAIVDLMGYMTDLGYPFDSQYIARGDEVLSPFWEAMNPANPVYVRQLAALHGCCSAEDYYRMRNVSNNAIVDGYTLRHAGAYGQSVLPLIQDSSGPAERLFTPDEPFKVQIAGYSSDSGFNGTGHSVRFWAIRDRNGVLVPGAFFVIQDFVPTNGCSVTGGNPQANGLCDFNDNVYLVTNIQPAESDQYGLTYDTDITVSIAESEDPVLLNDELVYTVTVSNLSIYQAPDVQLSFNLPANTNLMSYLPTVGSCSDNGSVVSCSLGAILGENSETVMIRVRPQVGGYITASASVTTTRGDENPTNNQTQVQTYVLDPQNPPAQLTIIKDAQPNSEEAFNFEGALGNFVLGDFDTLNEIDHKINFQENLNPLAGYDILDEGDAYGTYSTSYGTYGWRTVNNGQPVDATANAFRFGAASNISTMVYMQRGDCCATGVLEDIYWEFDLPNGTYDVTVGVGHPGNASGRHIVRAEGQVVIDFMPVAPTYNASNTISVNVTDGKLTLDPGGGTNTKINYVHIYGLVNLLPTQQTFNYLSAGTYSVVEQLPVPWELSQVQCVGNALAPISIQDGAAITVVGGENVTCTFVNTVITTPSIDIQVTPLTQQTVAGGDALFTVSVTNNGTSTLDSIQVTSDVAACDNAVGTLASLANFTYDCTLPGVNYNVTTHFDVIGTISGQADTVTDSDTAHVVIVDAGLSISKSPDNQTILEGENAVFTIRVENTGTVNLSNVTVTDAQVAACDKNLGTMIPGKVETYVCTANDVTTTFTNVAVATADLAGGNQITVEDSALVVTTTFTRGTAVYRINGGGAQVAATDGGPVWRANNGTGSQNFLNAAGTQTGNVNTGQIDNTGDIVGRHSSAPAYVPDAVFNIARWDNTTSPEMEWTFPVTPGYYEVRLYFANLYSGTSAPNQRLFDVSIEGQLALDDFDISAEFGHQMGGMKDFIVQSDNEINIDFAHFAGKDNPLVNGIEIIPLNLVPQSALLADPTSLNFGNVVLGNAPADLTVDLTNLGAGGSGNIQITDITLAGTNAADFSVTPGATIPATLTTSAPNNATTLTVGFDPASVGTKSARIEITHDGINESPLIIYLNAAVQPTPQPQLMLDTQQLSFSALVGTGADSATVEISSSEGSPTYTFDLTGAPVWLTGVTPVSGVAPSTGSTQITIDVDNTGLPPSTYTHILTATAPGYQSVNLELQIQVNPIQHTVNASVDGGNGTINPSGSFVVNDGADVTFTIAPDQFYLVGEVLVNGVDTPVVGNTLELQNISEDTTVVVTFASFPQYTITPSVNGVGGTIIPSTSFQLYQGQNTTLTITPSGGYTIGQVLVNGVDTPVTGNSLQLTNVTEDKTVVVTFEPLPQYTITVNPAINGVVAPNGTFSVLEGSDQTFTLTPNSGYLIGTVTVNSVPVVVTGNTFSLTNITEDQTVNVIFDQEPPNCHPYSNESCETVPVPVAFNAPYCVAWNGSAGGVLDNNGVGTGFTAVDPPSNNLFPVTPSDSNVNGYEPGNLLVNTTNGTLTITTTKGIMFTSANSQVNALSVGIDASVATIIEATYINPTFPGSNAQQAGLWFGIDEDNYVKLVLGLNAGVPRIQLATEVLGGSYPLGGGSPNEANVATGTVSSSTVTMRLILNPVTNQVTGEYEIDGGATGTVGPLPVLSTFFSGKTLPDGETGPVSFAGLFATHRNGTTPFNATFGSFCVERDPNLPTHDITATADANGTISPSGVITVAENDDQTFIITPDPDYVILDVEVDGASVGAVSSYTFQDVTQDHTIHATFLSVDEAVTVTPSVNGAGGLISPDTPQLVAQGTNLTFDFTPATGYTLDTLLVNDVPVVVTGNSYELVNIQEDTTVVASFRLLQAFTVTPSVDGGGGTISPDTQQLVEEGDDITFTFTPDAGNALDEVLVNGTPVTVIGDEYTITNVTQNTTISVSFVVTCSPISPFSCASVPVSVLTPYVLNFNGTDGGIQDKEGVGTGFTMVDPPSNNLFPETPSVPSVPGYEPDLLSVLNGELVITSTKGIQSTNVNSQVNALGVAYNPQVPVTIETTLLQPNLASPNQFQQVGLWFGLDEDNYIKLVLLQTGRVQLLVESGGSTPASQTSDVIANYTTKDITLRIVVDGTGATPFVRGLYSENGVDFIEVATFNPAALFFTGQPLPNTVVGNYSFAGIFTTSRNSALTLNFRFEDFSITPDPAFINTDPVITDPLTAFDIAEGATETITTENLEYTDAEQSADELIYVVTSLPANGTLMLNLGNLAVSDTFTQQDIDDGLLTYTHDGTETASDSFGYIITDGFLVPGISGTFNITVNNTNDNPQVVANEPLVVNEGATETITTTELLYTDEEQSAVELTFTVDVATTAGTVYLDGVALAATSTFTQQDVIDGLLSYTQDGSETATDSFTFTLSDGVGGSVTGTFNINVTLVDDLPIAVDDTATVDEGGTITALDGGVTSVLANDSDEEGAVTVVSNTAPTNGTVTVNPDGTFEYVHDGSPTTTDSFTYTIEDSGGQQATATVTITINPVDDLPVAVDDAITVENAGTATLLDGGANSVLANDSDEEGAVTVVSNTAATNGTVTVNPDGTFEYVHNGSATTTDSFTYTIEDSGGQQATATVTITIIPANEVPVAVDDTATVDEGGTITELDGGVATVLDNDSDADADPIRVVSNTDPTYGSVTVASDGTFTYTHDGTEPVDEAATDSFQYTITDDRGGFATATVTITINPINDDPVAVTDEATVSEGSSVSVLDSGELSVLANDTDPDNTVDELSVTGNTNGTYGSVTVNADGTFTYTQDQPVVTPTTDSFTYDISDGAGGTATGTVNVTILPPNNAPDAVDDTATVLEGGTITELDGGVASVLANDTDPDLDPLEVLSNTQPTYGTLTLNGDGTFSYTHDGSEPVGPAATDSFTYTIRDGRGGVDTATVTLTIIPQNDDPVAVDDTLTVDEGTTATELDGGVTSVLANDTDVDSATLTVESATNGTYGTVTMNPDGTFTYAHDGTEPIGAAATDSFTYTVIDGDGGSAIGTVTVTINPVNDAPVANDDTATVTENVALTINVIANDTDEEGAVVGSTVAIVTAPQHGTAVPNGTGGVLYTPTTDYVGPDSFTYTVEDEDGAVSNIATVSITVVIGNVAPVAVDDVATTQENQPVVINVLANDTDDQDSFGTVTIVTGPTKGTATANANGTVTYTPNQNTSGSDSFTYTVNDTQGLTSNVATVSITVFAVNDAPVLVNNTGLSAGKGERVTITSAMLQATDVDNTVNEILFEIQTAPTNGVLLRNGIVIGVAQAFSQADINNGLIAYQHFDAVTFSDSFVFTVSDGATTLPAATFNIQITGLVSDLPINLDVEGSLNSMPVALEYEWTHMTNINATNVPAQWYHIVVINAAGVVVVDEWVPAGQVCNGVSCVFHYLDKTPPYVFESGVYTWYVEGWIDPDGDGIGEIVTSDVSQFTVNIPPSQGIVGIAVEPNQGRPTISWDDDPGATWYQIYLGNSQIMYYLEWLPKSGDLCEVGGRCTLTPDINPLAGTYDVWIRSWSPVSGFIQNGIEGWEGPVSVTLPNIAPLAVTATTATATNSGRPTFFWQGMEHATWYEVWVGQSNGDGSYSTTYRQWHLAASLGCENAEQCRLDAEVDLANGTYEWAVRNWGPGGYNNNDPNVWSAVEAFTVGASTPGIPDPGTPVSIASTSQPLFTWSSVEDASWYQLWFGTPDNPESGATQWYTARQLGCVEAGTVCSVSFPGVIWPMGNYQWAIQAYSPGGLGEWSGIVFFSVSG